MPEDPVVVALVVAVGVVLWVPETEEEEVGCDDDVGVGVEGASDVTVSLAFTGQGTLSILNPNSGFQIQESPRNRNLPPTVRLIPRGMTPELGDTA